jgi:two-component system chemotaxis response regulator CheB
MPRAALDAVEADRVTPACELPGVLAEIVRQDAGPRVEPPDSLVLEVDVACGRRDGSAALSTFSEPTTITCPDCGGVLSQVQHEKPLRFRCQIGHAYTAEELAARGEKLDEAIRIALRVMQERADLVRRMARDARANGRLAVAQLYDQRTEEYSRYAATLRDAAVSAMRMEREARDESP